LALLLAPSACMTSDVPMNDVTQDQLALNPFDTAASRPEILLTGKLAGRLRSNGRCLVVYGGSGPVTPLWPEGTVLRRENGRLLLQLPDGRGSAEIGSRVQLGGGAFAQSGEGQLAGWVRGSCPQVFFAVSNTSE
jgi:hypothetical protein